MLKILIRADGGKNIGIGHIMRTLVLAKELEKESEVFYICKNSEEYLQGIDKVENEGFKVFKINEEFLIDNIKKIQSKINADILITDSYDVNEHYFNEMKKIFKYSGYIDDINVCKLNVDFIINQNINAKEIQYITNSNTKLFLGTDYCLLREEFRRSKSKIINEKVRDILITVGGSDKDYNILKLANIVKEFNVNVHIVIGSAFEEELINKLESLTIDYSNIKLYMNAKMSKLMEECDLAISSSGSTLYELCAMQVPTIGIVVAKNQLEICKKFNDKKVIVGTDDLIYTDLDKLSKIIKDVIQNKEFRLALSNNQREIVNKYGVRLLVKEILSAFN